MMGRWMERAAVLEREAQAAPLDSVAEANCTNSTNCTGGLSQSVTNGLLKLRSMRPPRRLISPGNWAGVIQDAESLLMAGWVGQAIKLGWRPVELFGVSDDYDGLAVWLDGRRLVLLDEHSAIAVGGPSRFHFNRRDPSGAVMLWDWGR